MFSESLSLFLPTQLAELQEKLSLNSLNFFFQFVFLNLEERTPGTACKPFLLPLPVCGAFVVQTSADGPERWEAISVVHGKARQIVRGRKSIC